RDFSKTRAVIRLDWSGTCRELRFHHGDDVTKLCRVACGAPDQQCSLQRAEHEAGDLGGRSGEGELAARRAALEDSGEPLLVGAEKAVDAGTQFRRQRE